MMNLPIEFEKKMKAFLGDEWDDFLYSYDNNRFQALRFNTLKVQSQEERMRILKVLGISPNKKVSWADEAYYFDENVRPGKHPYHEMGLYYIQEPSAMSAAALLAPKPGMRVLDMCTGSGCIAVSIDKICGDADVTAVDVSENALKTAKKNSENILLFLICMFVNLFENIDEKYDIIVSNPPYIPTKVIEGLMPEVRDYEPMLALDGEKDGLLFYEKITEQACMHLKHGGYILYEIGCEQAQAVSDILAEKGYRDIKVYKDLAGLDRVVTAGFE